MPTPSMYPLPTPLEEEKSYVIAYPFAYILGDAPIVFFCFLFGYKAGQALLLNSIYL